ncbi:thioredoxin [Salinigranum rubrum]|uniref:Thioredoxin n=1 Tax=Salinigranum rubrum TaxID=755307 RepID=A0A2I8VH98_9EURY|nr:thioredoxin [Salinigranum rubrum]AUV81301.1 thioredoxin [Salinigranum rubrum]
MSDSEELADIRRRKREELERRLQDGESESSESPEAPSTPQHIESANHLDEFVASNRVVLVDFYADWCGPCKMLEPTVERVARETPAAVAKVDIDSLQGLASQYQVRGVPTLLLFSGGAPVERVVGVRDYGTLASLVSEYAA